MSNSTNSSPTDVEISSSSDQNVIMRGLNEDLAREYDKAIIQYVVFSSTLKGATEILLNS
jgi:hypothetical protein